MDKQIEQPGMSPVSAGAMTMPAPNGMSGTASLPDTTNTSSQRTQQRRRKRRSINFPTIPMPANIKGYLTLLGVLVSAVAIWWMDGYFTLWFLEGWTAAVKSLVTFRWLIPLAITAGTLHCWPSKAKFIEMWEIRSAWLEDDTDAKFKKYTKARNHLMFHVIVFTVLTLFNVGSSTTGLMDWGTGRTINLFGHHTLPTSGAGLTIPALITGIIGAFAPEKLVRWVESEWKDL